MPAKNLLPNLGRGNTVIYGCIVGSHAYGTNVEGSDIDKKWIYVQSAESFFTHGYKAQIDISKDEVAYELSRFFELAEKANPTILELLFSPEDCILYKHELFNTILRLKKAFLTKTCRFSFGGYALSQIEKAKGLDKKMNWEKEKTERKSILDFCYFIECSNVEPSGRYKSEPLLKRFSEQQVQMMGLSSIPHTRDLYNVYHDAKYTSTLRGISLGPDSNDVCLSNVPEDAYCIGMLYCNKDAYSQHCKLYNEYETWLKHRNTQRYVDIESHGQKIDGKNMLHCIRLIETAADIAEYGELIVRRTNAEFLKEIRHGKVDLESILEYAKEKVKEVDNMFIHSALPDKFIEKEYLKTLNSQIRRFLSVRQETDILE